MKRLIYSLGLGSYVWLISGCSLIGPSESFTVTADLPPNFFYKALAKYVPAKGQTCTVLKNQQSYNREYWEEYQPTHEIPLYPTFSGCPMELRGVAFEIIGVYGRPFYDDSVDEAYLQVRDEVPEGSKGKGIFDPTGESILFAECQWLFRTMGGKRRLVKLLDCLNSETNVPRTRAYIKYTLDELPGKTVKLHVKLAEEEKPAFVDTWVKVPGGWKRCMGDNFEDQDAFCHGNHTDFSTFKMVDGRVCTIYPGCTENKEHTP